MLSSRTGRVMNMAAHKVGTPTALREKAAVARAQGRVAAARAYEDAARCSTLR